MMDVRKGDWLSALRYPPNPITAAATALPYRWNLCTGTSADYTVTIPPAASFKDGFIGFRMGISSALTKLVTLDGNSSETIDETTTRIMFSGEAAVLYSDGSNLFKVGGKPIAMSCALTRDTDQTGVAAGVWTACSMTAQAFGVAAMYDSGNGRIKVVRPGLYAITSGGYVVQTSGTATLGYLGTGFNSSTPGIGMGAAIAGGGFQTIGTIQKLAAVNDYFAFCIYCDATTSKIAGATSPAEITAIEQQPW